MACCNPQFIHKINGFSYQLPCGYCLNCRKDKQQYYIDRAEYELKKRVTASFVTFTYDDNWNILLNSVKNPLGGFEYDVASDGSLVPRFTLNYKHLTHFIESIRHYIKSHTNIQNIMCQPDFSYLYVGEYGDLFKRNHFHILFFGLDFAYCKKLIFSKWKYGFIDVLPVLDGAIRYVVKYMDKQVFGESAEILYDLKGLERPKIRMSQGFGKGLLLDNIDYIKSHDLCYPTRHNHSRPLSQYWKKLLTGNIPQFLPKNNYSSLIRRKTNQINEMKQYNLKNFSSHSRESFNIKKLLNRERDLEIRIRNSGYPVQHFEDVRFTKYYSPSYRHSITEIPIVIQRVLADNYRQSLSFDDDIPF